jgi:hypothetical protein
VALANNKGLGAAGVRRRYRGLIASLARHRASCGGLAVPFDHFRKVARSYWAGLFRCYEVEGLPRTNNDLEQFFGSYRYNERRASGRKVACPGTVVRGSVRPVAAAATRQRPIEVADLIPSDLPVWRSLRGSLERRQAVRTLGRRFRHDRTAYLKSLDDTLIKEILPPQLFRSAAAPRRPGSRSRPGRARVGPAGASGA